MILIIGLLSCFCVYGQQKSIDCRLTESFINQDMKTWNVFVDEISTEFEKNHSEDLQFKRMVVRHLYLAYLLFNDPESKQIDIQLEGLNSDIEDLKKSVKYGKISLAFRSPYLAYAALNNPVTAVYRLPMSFSAAKSAVSEAPDSPYSWSELGNLQYCYALFVGGKYDDAIASFKKAISLFESISKDDNCNWYYINTLLFLAKSYEDAKQYEKAVQVYDKILGIRSDYEAVKRWKAKNINR
ncbi:MAG: hypothetical protein MJ198_09845 [Bacteroidales bacterium]|nr:hypothetical protein [Bacteroidales bacterium]